ncbi:MAG: hypothetical protein EOP47_18925, partial [Sphingobacteriaceae bacterium]
MKKILFSICLLAASLTTLAQEKNSFFGIKGGVNFASMTASAQATNQTETSGSVTSFNAGIFADFKLGKTSKLSLQPSINLSRKGGKFYDILDENFNPIPNGTGQYNLL